MKKQNKKIDWKLVILIVIAVFALLYLLSWFFGYYQLNQMEKYNSFRVFSAIYGSEVGKYFQEKNLSLTMNYNESNYLLTHEDNATLLIIDARTYIVLEDKIK